MAAQISGLDGRQLDSGALKLGGHAGVVDVVEIGEDDERAAGDVGQDRGIAVGGGVAGVVGEHAGFAFAAGAATGRRGHADAREAGLAFFGAGTIRVAGLVVAALGDAEGGIVPVEAIAIAGAAAFSVGVALKVVVGAAAHAGALLAGATGGV